MTPILRTLPEVQIALSFFNLSLAAVAGQAAIDSISMHPAPLAFSKIPYMVSAFSNNIYFIVSLVPMHSLTLVVSKMLKECAVEKLCDIDLSATSMSSNCQENSFPSAWRKIMSSLSYFLFSVENGSGGFKLRVNLSKSTAPE